MNLTDASGAVVASYSYATWGALTASSETIPNAGGWVNPYRYDGRDRVLADPATGLDWLATRAYDPTTGRFLARDPLGHVPLFFADNPYAYAGNNPVSNVDPSGQYRAAGHGSVARESGAATNKMMARVVAHRGTPGKGNGSGAGCGGCKVKVAKVTQETCDRICKARKVAASAATFLNGITYWIEKLLLPVSIVFSGFQLGAALGIGTALLMVDAAMTATSVVFSWMAAQGNQFWQNANAVAAVLFGVVAIPGIIYGLGVALATSSAVATFLAASPEVEPLLLPFQTGLIVGGETEAYLLTAYNVYIAAEIEMALQA